MKVVVRRFCVVVACYLLSSYGLLLSLMLIGMAGMASPGGTLVGVLIVLAWCCHLGMSMNWILDRSVRSWVPLSGTAAGSLGLLLWPVAQPTIEHFGWPDVAHTFALGVAFTCPCVLLAIHLVRFHLQGQRRSADKEAVQAAR